MSIDVARLAEDGRGEPVRQERPDHGPGQYRDRRMKLRRHRGQGHNEHGEGEVQREEPRQQRPEDPPLVARRRARTVLYAMAQEMHPVKVTARFTAERAKGGACGVRYRVEEPVGVFSIKVRQRALVAHYSRVGSCAASSLTDHRSFFSSVSVIVQFWNLRTVPPCTNNT